MKMFAKVILLLAMSALIFSAYAQIDVHSNYINIWSDANPETVYLNGYLYLDHPGYLDCSGDFNCWGTKNFLQTNPTDTSKVIKYTCLEAGEVLTMVRGLAKTSSGIANIMLPDHFSLVTSDNAPLTVIAMPENAPSQLYVKSKSKQNIIMAIKNADLKEFGDVTFSYQVTGVRAGYENKKIMLDRSELPKKQH
jgi:hypothetical protein